MPRVFNLQCEKAGIAWKTLIVATIFTYTVTDNNMLSGFLSVNIEVVSFSGDRTTVDQSSSCTYRVDEYHRLINATMKMSSENLATKALTIYESISRHEQHIYCSTKSLITLKTYKAKIIIEKLNGKVNKLKLDFNWEQIGAEAQVLKLGGVFFVLFFFLDQHTFLITRWLRGNMNWKPSFWKSVKMNLRSKDSSFCLRFYAQIKFFNIKAGLLVEVARRK